MPVLGSRSISRPGSRAGSAPSSRAPSPAPLGSPSAMKLDSISIDGSIYDILLPFPAPAHENEVLPKELRVTLRYKVSFTLSKPVKAEAIKAEFRSQMTVVTDPGEGQFTSPVVETEAIISLDWTLWRGHTLEANKEYNFEFSGELPPKTPRTLSTPRGRIEHLLTVRFHKTSDAGRLSRLRKTIEVFNPYSMDADSPRPGLEFHADLEPEMIGEDTEVEKGLVAFLRFPDQCYKGIISLQWTNN